MKVSDIKEGLEKNLAASDLWFQWLMMEKMQAMMLLHSPLRDFVSAEQLLQIGEYLPSIEHQLVECVNNRQYILMQLENIGIQFPEN